MEKVKLGRTLRPCQDRSCDIRTNKRYRGSGTPLRGLFASTTLR